MEYSGWTLIHRIRNSDWILRRRFWFQIFKFQQDSTNQSAIFIKTLTLSTAVTQFVTSYNHGVNAENFESLLFLTQDLKKDQCFLDITL